LARRAVWDYSFLVTTLLLVGFGLLVMYSVTSGSGSGANGNVFSRQLWWVGIGLLALAVAAFTPLRLLDGLSYIAYVLAVGFLVAVLLVPGAGAHRWFRAGPISIQPSEFAKLATVLALASYLSGRRLNPKKFRTSIPAWGIALVPFVLILKQPDLGTALTFPVVAVVMLYWAGVGAARIAFLLSPVVSLICASSLPAWVVFFVLLCVAVYFSRLSVSAMLAILLMNIAVGVVTPRVWSGMPQYQKERILCFVNPSRDPYGAGYQIIQSKIAIGSGGLWGKGYLQGTQKALNFLPQQHTDFAFSVLGEEMGFVAVAVVLVLYGILLWRALVTARSARNGFASLVSVGLASVFLYHVFVNIGMTLGLAPVTGLPLPFISYGGSFLGFCMASVGLFLNASARRLDYW